MNEDKKLIEIRCPLCNNSKSTKWANENGFTAVKCDVCGLIYVNPCPSKEVIDKAVKTGFHEELGNGHSVIVHRVSSKVKTYNKIFEILFSDVWKTGNKITWLDVGAGYGEIVEAVSKCAPKGSEIIGIEPMIPKVMQARARNLNIIEGYLSKIDKQYSFVSLINVFSHILDFHSFLCQVKRVLKSKGEFLIETGNIGDLSSYKQVPTELDLPDHLVFAGEKNIIDFLNQANFEIISIMRRRKDGFINFCKNIIKKMIGRKVTLALPYTSPYRSLIIRARLKS